METTAKSLREDFENKLKNLQENCKHEDLSNWIEEWWAPGHITGFMVKQCNTCEKIISRKTSCWECRKEIIDNDIKKGDGKTIPFGGNWCADCIKKLNKKG